MKRAPNIISNKAVVRRIQDLTGYNREDAAIAYRATIRAIVEILKEGNMVNLHGVGTFYYGFRKGRTIPEGSRFWRGKNRVQADSRPIRFVISSKLKIKLKGIVPLNSPPYKYRPPNWKTKS